MHMYYLSKMQESYYTNVFWGLNFRGGRKGGDNIEDEYEKGFLFRGIRITPIMCDSGIRIYLL